MNKVKVFGAEWCEDTQRTRQHLDNLKIPYDYINIDHDKAAEKWITEQNNGKRKTPTIDLNGKILIEPTNEEVDAALNRRGED
jgi:glutaredoxin